MGRPPFLPSVPGLLTQSLHGFIQQRARGGPRRRLKAKGQVHLAGTNGCRECLNHRHRAIAGGTAKVRQITGFRGHIKDQHLSIGAQHHVRFLPGFRTITGGRRHHGRATDQHLAGQDRHLIRHLSMDRPSGMGNQPLKGAIRVAENPCGVWIVLERCLAQSLAGLVQPALFVGTDHLATGIVDGRQQRGIAAGRPPSRSRLASCSTGP